MVVNEIARKQEEDDDEEDAERASVSPRIDEPLPTHTGQLLQLPLLNTSHSSDDPSPNNTLLSPRLNRLQMGEELRNSPSLNLDDIVYDTHRRRPESLSEDEWRMIQSIYIPRKPENGNQLPDTHFQPISVDVSRDNRSFNRHSLSPAHRQPISPNLNETRKIFQPDHNSRPTTRPRIFGQFSPPPRRRLHPDRQLFYSPTRQMNSPPLYDLRTANQRELENQMAERQALENNTLLNGFRSSTSPTRQPPFSVVPPNRSMSPLSSHSSYRELSPRNWTTTVNDSSAPNNL